MKLKKLKNYSIVFVSEICVVLCATPSFAQGATNTLALISLLADVKELTSGLTLNQTAASSVSTVTVLGITTTDGPESDTGIFSAGASTSLSIGGASAQGNAQATVGNWEPFSSAGTVLTVQPTTATAALINNQPASASAAAKAAINGFVKSTQVIAPPFAQMMRISSASSQTVPVLFALQFSDVMAQLTNNQATSVSTSSTTEVVTFEYGIDFSDSSYHSDITFIKGQIGGSGNTVEFPFIESSNPELAKILIQQFLDKFSANEKGEISVSSFMVGEGILPSQPDGATGLEFNTTLNEEYVITGGLNANASASVQPVPEPLTILGSATALGFGGFLKRKLKLSKSNKKES